MCRGFYMLDADLGFTDIENGSQPSVNQELIAGEEDDEEESEETDE